MTVIKQWLQTLGVIAKLILAQGPAYVSHLLLAWLISWALRHGFHVGVPYFQLSVLTFFGATLGRHFLEQFGYGWHSGAAKALLAVSQEEGLKGVNEALVHLDSLLTAKAPAPEASPYL